MAETVIAEFDLGDGGRPWQLPEGSPGPYEAIEYYLGNGSNALEVAVAISGTPPTVGELRRLWGKRHAGRPSPVLCVVLYRQQAKSWRASICGPTGEDPPAVLGLDVGQVRRLCRAALDEPDRHAATRFLLEALPASNEELVGLRNVGMFASHELSTGVPARPDWDAACELGRQAIEKSGRELVEVLGFELEDRGPTTTVLRAEDNARAVAVFLDETESPEGAAQRFGGTSPATHGLAAADRDNLPYVLLTRGRQIRVYATGKDVGVGRKGRAETYVEANLALLPDDAAGYLPLVFGAEALRDGGTFEDILERSRDYSTALGSRLRDRVYEDVVPALAKAVVGGSRGKALDDLEALYQQALVILFRLLFIAYAEDKDLLPYRASSTYQRNALKTLARDLADRQNAGSLAFDSASTDLWNQALQLFAAVHQGNSEWQVPEYDGGLFSSDPDVSPSGAAIAKLKLTNEAFGEPLATLLVDRDENGLYGPVDFRSLSVREFGTIYEGLLESSLSLAAQDLTADRSGAYLPAGESDPVLVPKGEIYLHNRSGSRKATGSYFTKPFAVEHLLQSALEPALDDHLKSIEELLEAGRDAEAADAFFDFRCADIAMGSGHFLVAAVDHIEARLSSFLADHAIPEVVAELERLRLRAVESLGELAAGVEIEQSSLLRRQVARRCVYGVDRNEIAVELARLALWIHTFVPGLPLSFLDHNLVCGDSLTGIGAVEEAAGILSGENGSGPSLFEDQVRELLDRASDALGRLARASDADAKEIARAREAAAEAAEAVEPVADLFDLLVAVRLGQADRFEEMNEEVVARHRGLSDARELAADLNSLHFPVAFPEVFLRDRPGFDCLLGNPPWEKVKVEEHGFWALRFPRLRALPVGQQNAAIDEYRASRPDLDEEYQAELDTTDALRAILLAGGFPGMGSGDPDLYKAFAWRFWHLARQGGAVGIVLPRSALAATGSAPWREEILDGGGFSDVTLLVNNRKWVFEDVHAQWTVALLGLRKGARFAGCVRMRGPYRNLAEFRAEVERNEAAEFPVSEFRTWMSGSAFPLLPTTRSGDVFRKMRAHPRFDDPTQPWRARPVRELDATLDKKHMELDVTGEGLWPVYKGASFDLWQPDTGDYYAWADPDHVTEVLQAKRERGARHSRSAFSEMPPEWISDPSTLPCLHPRIAFRDVTRATDSRTLRTALVPPDVVLNHKAPYLLLTRGHAGHEAFLLGLMSSIPFDWFTRRCVEVSMTFDHLISFPVPADPETADGRELTRIAIELQLRCGDDLEDWAASAGSEGSADDADFDQLIARLDAATARLYGLDADDVKHIFETFHEGWDPAERLDHVLAHYADLPAS
jgi:hypothetical protein